METSQRDRCRVHVDRKKVSRQGKLLVYLTVDMKLTTPWVIFICLIEATSARLLFLFSNYNFVMFQTTELKFDRVAHDFHFNSI
mmetsp:Transcript_15090/g.34533  ORF Transcript_15090/g.34533 Transcript_15090/m.34533 type:complete len:84 (+) Transcript_15090:166-417(+)